ncbi:MAG: hypothetical protein ABSD85_14970 [Acidimicrobiales bacterium]|jgi:hypothetical protein
MAIGEAQLAGVAVSAAHTRPVELVDMWSTSSLAGAMRELALDSATRSRRARTGPDLARQCHDPERLITAIEVLLDTAAHDHRAKTDRTV